MAEHTKTPWRMGNAKGFNGNMIFDCDDEAVCFGYLPSNTPIEVIRKHPRFGKSEDFIKMEYIVHCVNAHEGLVEFREKIASLHGKYSKGELTLPAVYKLMDSIGQALAQAEVKHD